MKNIGSVLVLLVGMGTAASVYAGELSVTQGLGAASSKAAANHTERAKQFLFDSAAQLGIQSDLNDLKVESVTETAIGSHVRFAQMQGGLQVDGAGVVVTVNQNNEIVSFSSDYSQASGFEKAAPRFDIPQDKAIEIANNSLNLTASPTRETVVQKVMMMNGQSRPVYQVNLSAPVDKKWSWEVVVDANSGAIYRSETRAYDVGVTATMFAPNPTIKSGKAFGTVTGYSDDGTTHANSAFYDSMLSSVTLDVDAPAVTSGKKKVAALYALQGKYVKITDQETPKNPVCTSKTPNMSYKRGDKCFTDASAYYFVSESIKYLNETLGIKAGPINYAGAFHVDPHGLDGQDNSHYDGQSDEIAFGDGGVPDAQDHDVLHHELGHAIHNWVTKGHLSQVEGLSEGIGDYWAASYSRSFMKKGDVAYDWTFSFDGHNNFWPGRVVNVAGKYPAAAQGEIHDAGQLWATVCIEIWDTIGKAKMDKIFWSGIAMLSSSSSQLDAAKAVYAAAKTLYPTDADAVKAKFVARGYNVQ